MIKLSVIIPALNEEEFLPGLLRSIKNQTFKDYEIILADAGSKDRTIPIAKRYGARVIKGGLPAKGRNEGAKAAEGDLLLFLDADTKLPTKDFLRRSLGEFNKRNLDIASCRLAPLEKSKIFKKRYLITMFEAVNYLMIASEKIAPFGVGSMILVKKNLHQKLGGFDENIRFGEDTVYIRKAAKQGKFGILKTVRILWSIRRWEKEKWLKTIILYIMCWFLIGVNEKKLDIFKRGFFEYKFGHYKEKESKERNSFSLKDFKKWLKTKIL